MNLKLIAFLTLTFSIVHILFLSFIPAYFYHLRVDLYGQYISHAKSFLAYGNLANIGYNEYQPIAVIFFITLAPALNIINSFLPELNYVFAVYSANILLILVNAFLYLKITKNYISILMFSLVLIATGPIILHRFELLLFLFILLSILAFEFKSYLLSGFFLGIAFCTKIFPIFLLPIFTLNLLVTKKYKELGLFITGLVFSLLFVYVFFNLFLKGDFVKIFADLKIHQIKPVHAESIYASIITVIPWLQGNGFALGKGAWGIFGIDENFIILPLFFYNYFFILPLGLFYIFATSVILKTKKIHYELFFLLMILFLIFSKIVTAQYLLWYMLFLPLFDIKKYLKSNTFVILIFSLVLCSFLTQFIYPLKYNELLGEFFQNGNFSEIFWVLFLRNILIVVSFILGLVTFIKVQTNMQINSGAK